MAVILLLSLVTIFTIVSLLRRSAIKNKQTTRTKAALLVAYATLIVQSLEIENAATQADTYGLTGGSNGWFGSWWFIVWMLNLVAIIALHVRLVRLRSAKEDTSRANDSPIS
jgi:uncharacterized membrane protein